MLAGVLPRVSAFQKPTCLSADNNPPSYPMDAISNTLIALAKEYKFLSSLFHVLEALVFQFGISRILGFAGRFKLGLAIGTILPIGYFYGREIAQLEKKLAGPGGSVHDYWWVAYFPKNMSLDGFLDFALPAIAVLVIYFAHGRSKR